MALIEINLDPSERDIKWFGLLALVFFLLIGGLVLWLTSAEVIAMVLWAIGVIFSAVYYAIPPLRRVMYRGWLKLFSPIGWVIGHALFAIIYYGVFTLIGMGLKLFGFDPLHRRRKSGVETYWIPHKTDADTARYFRQF